MISTLLFHLFIQVSRLARNRHAEAVEWRKVALEAAAKMIRMEKEKEELRAQICALTKLNEVELADATAKIILLEKKEEELLAQMQERTEFHEETLARELAELVRYIIATSSTSYYTYLPHTNILYYSSVLNLENSRPQSTRSTFINSMQNSKLRVKRGILKPPRSENWC